jgi:hypothetical protein
MPLPKPHSCTGSDEEPTASGDPADHERDQETPQALEGKELYLWVTYPDNKARKAKKKSCKKAQRSRQDLKLWAVIIIEALERRDAFTYEVALRKVFKRGESMIKVWVRNDPQDQSEEAAVFGFISPAPEQLTQLEQQLSHLAAKRIYDAVARTWPDARSAT